MNSLKIFFFSILFILIIHFSLKNYVLINKKNNFVVNYKKLYKPKKKVKINTNPNRYNNTKLKSNLFNKKVLNKKPTLKTKSSTTNIKQDLMNHLEKIKNINTNANEINLNCKYTPQLSDFFEIQNNDIYLFSKEK